MHVLPSRMRWGIIVSLSVVVHLWLLFLFRLYQPIEYGAGEVTHTTGRLPSVFAVNFATPPIQTPKPPSWPTITEELLAVPEIVVAEIETSNSPLESADQLDRKKYLQVGRLTRLPVPLAELDLNDIAIDEVAIEGSIELTLLVEVDGTVAHVAAMIANEDARLFADRVAARFRNMRFSPGEIDGTPVKSELVITVTSKPVSKLDSTL